MDMAHVYQPSSMSLYPQPRRPDSAAGSLRGGKPSSIHELVTKSSPYSGSIRRDDLDRDYRRESVENLMHDLEVAGISSAGERTYGDSNGVVQSRNNLSRSRDGRDEDELLGVGGMRTLGLRA